MLKLDSALNLLLPQPEVFANKDFTPEQSITDVRNTEGSDNTLVVFVPPWHANLRMQHRLESKQLAAGHSVLAYSLHDDILSSDTERTVFCFDYIGTRIANDVKEFTEAHPTAKVRYVAASLGCAVLTKAMGTHGLQGNVDLVVPGGDLASGLWQGIRTQHLRKAYEAQDIDEIKLRSLWHDLAPAYQATKIHNSKFRLFVSAADLVIPFRTLERLVPNLQASGNEVELHINRMLGHFGTILLQEHLIKRA